MNSDFDALWTAMIEAPLDAAPRLILADWCDEHGEELLATGLRSGRAIVATASLARRKRNRQKWLTQWLREHGTKVLEDSQRKLAMSLTYNDGSRYSGKIVKWGISESKNKTPQAFFMVMIEKEVDAKGETYDCPQYERTVYRALTENTIDWVVDELAKLGFTGTSFNQLRPDDPNAHDFAGTEVKLRCKHETFEGKTREKFEFDFGSKAPEQLDKSGVSKLDQLFGSKLKMAASTNKPRPATPKPPAKSPSEELEEAI